MSPVLFIRKHVLGLSQAQLAAELDVTQPTVQRWETAGLFPAEQQIEVRRLGMAACKTWSDTWFFEVPEAPRAPASGGPRAQLLAAVAAYCTRTGMSRARLATIVVRDGKFFTRIDRGGDFTVTTFEKFMAYFAPGHGRSAEGRRR